MQERHTNRERYFEEQAHTTRNYYIPYIKKNIGNLPNKIYRNISRLSSYMM